MSKDKIKFEILNYIPEVQKYLASGFLDDEVRSTLYDFGKFNVDRYLDEVGQDTFETKLKSSIKLFNELHIERRLTKILAAVQKIQPTVKIQPFPLYFLFADENNDAKSFGGNAVAINLGYFAKRLTEDNLSEQIAEIEAACIHESVHVFLNQLKLSWKHSDLNPLIQVLWEDGLTTLIETEYSGNESLYYSDAAFWLDAIKEWLNTESDDVKNELLAKSFLNETLMKIGERNIRNTKRMLVEGESLDEAFLSLLFHENGPIYHAGKYLWEFQLKKGRPLDQLVKEGAGSVEGWLARNVRLSTKIHSFFIVM